MSRPALFTVAEYCFRPVPSSGYTAPVALLDWENMLGLGDQQPLATELAVEHAVLDPDRLTQPEAVATARRIDEFDARSTLKQRADEAEAVRRAMLGPIVPLTVAGVLAGLAVLAAATRRWARAARGPGPGGGDPGGRRSRPDRARRLR